MGWVGGWMDVRDGSMDGWIGAGVACSRSPGPVHCQYYTLLYAAVIFTVRLCTGGWTE